MIVKKGALDNAVARRLGMKSRDVSEITEAFLEEARNALTDLHTVWLNGLGTLRVVTRRGKVDSLKPIHSKPLVAKSKKKYHVSFKKSGRLTSALRERYGKADVEEVMEKDTETSP